MAARIKVFLVAGHRLLRDALGRSLGKRTDIIVIGESPVLPDVASLIVQAQADVVLTDAVTSFSTNLHLLSELRKADPNAKVLMIGVEKDERMFLEAVRAGVMGYLLRDASATDVVAAIRAVAAGEAVCPSRLCLTLFKALARDKGPLSRVNLKVERGLTRRERELIPLIAKGLTNREIASHLNLSEQTIKNYVHRMLQKIGVEDRLKMAESARV